MPEPCADRCTVLADVLARLARAEGKSESHERLSFGLTPEFVPPLPRTTTAVDARWWEDNDSD